MTTKNKHLHRDDCPATLELLDALVGRRTDHPGFEPTESGAFVDWDEIESKLSTSEVAVVHIARGLSILESHGGGLPSRLRSPVLLAVEKLV